jgi:hypothetical protein
VFQYGRFLLISRGPLAMPDTRLAHEGVPMSEGTSDLPERSDYRGRVMDCQAKGSPVDRRTYLLFEVRRFMFCMLDFESH